MVHRVAFTHLLLAGRHLAPVMSPRSNSGHIHRVGQDVSCQAHPQGQHGEQAGGDATSPGGLPPPGTQQGHIFSHWCWVFLCSPSAAAGFPICQHSHTRVPDSGDTPEPITNVPWTSKELIMVERTRKRPGTALHILEPHPVALAQLEPPRQGPSCARGCPSREPRLRPASAGWWLRIKES